MAAAANVHPFVAVEVAVDSLAGAVAAARAGAHRLELCCALADGGLTPTSGLLRCVKDAVPLPVVAMLRPRGGDFLYEPLDFRVMLADVETLRAAGADALITGVLTGDGDLDVARMRELVQAAAPLPVACHRAFDDARDPAAVLEQLVALGVARVLTSGQKRTALEGAAAVAALVDQARGRIAVLAGGGVRAANVREIVARSGVREVHLSARMRVASAMRHRNADVAIGSAQADEYSLRQTDGAEVAAVVAAVAHR